MSQFHNLSAIHIKDINLWAHVGVLESERINGQSFVLDISFWFDLDESSKLDQLDKSIDYGEAIKYFNKAILINSKNPDHYLKRGISKQALGDRIGACEDWKKAAELGDDDAAKLLKEHCE